MPEANADQVDYWNAAAGETWARFQDRLDRQLEPLGKEAIRALQPQPGERILDIGCGCGQSSLDLATRVGPTGSVTGLDVSQPMLEVARARNVPPGAGALAFLEADAQTGDLGAGAFDAVYSRFGVMFFNDPPTAFANIRKALKPGGRLAFVCWRPYDENPWMRLPIEAAEPHLPPSPPRDPIAPGPFAFADPERVRAILGSAGFTEVRLDPFDARIGGSNVEQSLDMAFRIGPLGAALRENPQCADQVRDAVRAVLQGFDTPDGVRMPAAVWIVRARNP